MSLIIDAIKKQDPDKIALADDKGNAISYGELAAVVKASSVSLRGVKTLGIALDNGIEWIIWDLACLDSGTVCVPLPPFFTQEQRAHIVRAAGVSHIVTGGGIVKTGQSHVDTVPQGTAKITFTSGTTGAPKGVCLSREGIEQVATGLCEMLDPALAVRHMSVLPLAILLENIAGVYTALLAGGGVHVHGLDSIGMGNPFRPDFVQLAHALSAYKITSVILVPELLRGLMQAMAQTKLALPSLKFIAVGGSKVAPELLLQARSYGLPVYEGYGLSECASVVTLNSPENDRSGTVGKVLSHIDLSVENGEIVIRNPAFLGYLGMPHRGEFRTGDLGFIDGDGFVHIEGRKKNVLITSHGRNISPEWVESLLLAQPQIIQAVVYGDGQSCLRALVVPVHPGVDIEAAVEMANQALPEYARVNDFTLVPPFTMQDGTLTGTGRPKRDAIFSKYQSQITKQITKEYGNELLRTAG